MLQSVMQNSTPQKRYNKIIKQVLTNSNLHSQKISWDAVHRQCDDACHYEVSQQSSNTFTS